MNNAYELNTVFIKNSGVTDQELAIVAEHASDRQVFQQELTGYASIMRRIP